MTSRAPAPFLLPHHHTRHRPPQSYALYLQTEQGVGGEAAQQDTEETEEGEGEMEEAHDAPHKMEEGGETEEGAAAAGRGRGQCYLQELM